MSITNEEGLETHHKQPKVQGGSNDYKNLQLVHISCHIEYHREYPAKGEVPTQAQISQYCKRMKAKRLAGIL